MVIYQCPRCGGRQSVQVIRPRIHHCNGTVTLMQQESYFYCDGYSLRVQEEPSW